MFNGYGFRAVGNSTCPVSPRHRAEGHSSKQYTLEEHGQELSRVRSSSSIERQRRRKSGDLKHGDCYRWTTEGKCSKRDSCSLKHDMSKRGKGRNERETSRSPSPGPRSPRLNCKDGKCASNQNPEGIQSIWEKGAAAVKKWNFKDSCTDPSCDCWNPPDCVQHKSKEVCSYAASVLSCIQAKVTSLKRKKWMDIR